MDGWDVVKETQRYINREMGKMMKRGEIVNGQIERVSLGFEKGRLTSWLHINHELGSQAFGGYLLKNNKFITKILDTLEKQYWEDLIGCSLRVDGTSNKIQGIGHFIKDKWFYPKTDL